MGGRAMERAAPPRSAKPANCLHHGFKPSELEPMTLMITVAEAEAELSRQP